MKHFDSLTNSSALNLLGPLKLLDSTVFSPIDLKRPSIFIDGGSRLKDNFHFENALNFSLGDGDSSNHSSQLDIQLPSHKDLTDFEYALINLPGQVDELQLFGFIGERLDHQLSLLAALDRWLSEGAKYCSLEGLILAHSAGKHRININGSFSILSFENCNMSLKGKCRYQLELQEIPKLSGHTVSNEGLGEIEIHCDRSFFIFKNKMT